MWLCPKDLLRVRRRRLLSVCHTHTQSTDRLPFVAQCSQGANTLAQPGGGQSVRYSLVLSCRAHEPLHALTSNARGHSQAMLRCTLRSSLNAPSMLARLMCCRATMALHAHARSPCASPRTRHSLCCSHAHMYSHINHWMCAQATSTTNPANQGGQGTRTT